MDTPTKVRFNIDRGGTFTDIYAEVVSASQSKSVVLKLLSEDPDNYPNAPREAIRKILNEHVFKPNKLKEIGVHEKIPTQNIEWIRMGTTVATNALLERNSNKKHYGELPAPRKVVLVTTKGFGDLLKIGNQARPDIFDLTCHKPELLYDEKYVVEVDERVLIRPDITSPPKDDPNFRLLSNGEIIEIQKHLPKNGDEEYAQLVEKLKAPLAAGVTSVAVTFLHSYCFPDHEKAIGDLCKELKYTHISLSSELTPSVKAVARGHTATVDAFLTPYLESYINGFKSGFEDSINQTDVSFMKSDGGLCPVQNFSGYVSIVSGPAGGVVGFSQTALAGNNSTPEKPIQVVGFDMGGTSTDVSRVEGDNYQYVQETELDGVFIQATQLDINTVAAGGGSVLHFSSGNMSVGPDSVGSNPGPICYGKGTTLAITDANFLLGRILPKFFPLTLHYDKVQKAFIERAKEINDYNKDEAPLSPEQVAYGYLEMANEVMANAVKKITEAKGFDVTKHILAVFGGAGPQHACAIARSLGITKVQISRYCSILSAYGLGLANQKEEESEACRVDFEYNDTNMVQLNERLQILTEKTKAKLRALKFPDDRIEIKKYLNLRYQGADTIISIQEPANGNYRPAFEKEYEREFGFIMAQNALIVESIKVVALGKTPQITKEFIPQSTQPPKPVDVVKSYFQHADGTVAPFDTNVYVFRQLAAGDTMAGPCFIVDETYYLMIVVEPGCTASVSAYGHVEIDVPKAERRNQPNSADTTVDVVNRSLFIHRFMSIAEQMGVSLQRTAKSVNIKERLDFSCALFNHTGGLVANAPHLPVHLGAMAHAVKYQIETNGKDWKKDEVILSNHPAAGGSHLPDFTVITPVYYDLSPTETFTPVTISGQLVEVSKPIFYVASRAHHADIGGIAPGSMPPFSKKLVEEGAATKCLKIKRGNEFLEKEVMDFLEAPGKVMGVLPAARPRDNIDDLKAQIAANTKGINLVQELIRHYGLAYVLEMMNQVQLAAENAVRDMLRKVAHNQLAKKGLRSKELSLQASDRMDDGLVVKLKITIDSETGNTVFDFKGTSPETYGNLNAPTAVTSSAIIYALRALVNKSIPLNEGCMKPITINIPDGCFLSPSDTAAVVGGNVLTSQRVTDVILVAFGAQANSQGCMNNFTFGGGESPSYYETIAGGCGAGDHWHGQSAVQCHMTNTRITDPEILERRFPVKLLEFSVRKNSGGQGRFNGGNGVIRRVQFLKPNMIASILSERRAIPPNGIEGGLPGKRGKNYLITTHNGKPKRVYLGPKNTVAVQVGDIFCIKTPGGGGYGTPPTNKQ